MRAGAAAFSLHIVLIMIFGDGGVPEAQVFKSGRFLAY